MADEIVYGTYLFAKKNGKAVEVEFTKRYADMTGDVMVSGQQSIGTSAEVIAKPADMGTIGFVYVKNLHATASIEIGDDGDNPSIKLLAGQAFMGPWGATDVSCKASAEALIDFVMVEL